ncbi:Yip1-domain-containing protein [Hortaea werneckii]|nr:Yip1-domain-containing protein [Hortaea werneckii]KAI7478861.1 Yip1-domain-containing protein [Hortaea werneckii]KAI7491521.1 Yip1-domain-containing protein [Hortaea werneckii]
MMPSGSSPNNQTANPYEHYDAPSVEDDLIDPDDATLDDLEDPANTTSTSDRAPLTGNIGSSQAQQNNRSANQAGNYLTSAIPGEDRRAPMNTIDESVWDTLRRDLLAVWEKMRQVLWPKYLLGGILSEGGGMGSVRELGSVQGMRNLVGRWPDAETVLQGGMSEGLRDWDLWGPLLFCLILSTLLSLTAQPAQRSYVFSGVFATIWVAEAAVTLQIKLLGGNISFFQSVCIIGYTLFPLCIASLLSAIGIPMIVRIPVYIVLGLWSLAAGVSILGGSGVIKGFNADYFTASGLAAPTTWPIMKSMACAFVLRPAITLPSLDGKGLYVLTLVTGCSVEEGSGGFEHVIEGKGYTEIPGPTSGHGCKSDYDNNMSKIRQGRQATRGRERSAKKRKRRKIFFKLFMPCPPAVKSSYADAFVLSLKSSYGKQPPNVLYNAQQSSCPLGCAGCSAKRRDRWHHFASEDSRVRFEVAASKTRLGFWLTVTAPRREGRSYACIDALSE